METPATFTNKNSRQGQSQMAAGHVYNPATRTGIELIFSPAPATTEVNFAINPGSESELPPKVNARLWQVGELVAEGVVPVGTEGFLPDIVERVEAGKRRLARAKAAGEASPDATSASASYEATIRWHFWYNFWFREVFPQVTDWWFGSAWTQLVRLSAPLSVVEDGATVTGLMQFVDEEHPALPWTITDQASATLSARPLIATPLPSFEVNPLNLPLRLRLAELVVKLIQGDIRADQWTLVTSLVERGKLEEIFTTELPALYSATGEVSFSSNPAQAVTATPARRTWQLDDPRLEEASLLEVFCTMQGLRKP